MKILISVFSFAKVSATAQYPDKIFYNSKEYSLLTNPLEKYFERNEDKRPKGGVTSSALWRGYVATFEIIENQLFIKDIQIEIWDEISYDIEWKSVINEVLELNFFLIFVYGFLGNSWCRFFCIWDFFFPKK